MHAKLSYCGRNVANRLTNTLQMFDLCLLEHSDISVCCSFQLETKHTFFGLLSAFLLLFLSCFFVCFGNTLFIFDCYCGVVGFVRSKCFSRNLSVKMLIDTNIVKFKQKKHAKTQ